MASHKTPKTAANKAAEVGLVLGTVFVIMGFAYGNSGIWMIGFILLGIGAVARSKA
jgi:hypothetical protein